MHVCTVHMKKGINKKINENWKKKGGITDRRRNHLKNEWNHYVQKVWRNHDWKCYWKSEWLDAQMAVCVWVVPVRMTQSWQPPRPPADQPAV